MEYRQRFNPRLVIVVAAFAAFLATFNETYLNVAFSPIMADPNVDVNTIQWLATAYMLGAAIMSAMTTLGPSVSALLAGVLLAVAPWRVLLWIFAGLSTLCLLTGAVLLGDIAELTHPRLDAPSVILIGLALVGILYGVSTAFSGNIAVSAACVVVGFALFVPFVRRQKSLEQPLIDLRPLSVRPFAIGVVANMISLDSSRTPEWRLKARVVKRVRTFGDAVICRVTIGTVQPVDYAVTSSLAADVAALQDDVAGIDGNLSVATSTVYVQETVTEAIDELDKLADLDF